MYAYTALTFTHLLPNPMVCELCSCPRSAPTCSPPAQRGAQLVQLATLALAVRGELRALRAVAAREPHRVRPGRPHMRGAQLVRFAVLVLVSR